MARNGVILILVDSQAIEKKHSLISHSHITQYFRACLTRGSPDCVWTDKNYIYECIAHYDHAMSFQFQSISEMEFNWNIYKNEKWTLEHHKRPRKSFVSFVLYLYIFFFTCVMFVFLFVFFTLTGSNANMREISFSAVSTKSIDIVESCIFFSLLFCCCCHSYSYRCVANRCANLDSYSVSFVYARPSRVANKWFYLYNVYIACVGLSRGSKLDSYDFNKRQNTQSSI